MSSEEKESSVPRYIGSRISRKRYKLWMATAKTAEARAATKSFVLGKPHVFLTKKQEAALEAEQS